MLWCVVMHEDGLTRCVMLWCMVCCAECFVRNMSTPWILMPGSLRHCVRYKNITRHMAEPEQWLMIHSSDLWAIIWRTDILTIIKIEIGKLKNKTKYKQTNEPKVPIYCIKDNWENEFNLRDILDMIYLTNTFISNVLQQGRIMMMIRKCNVRMN